MAFSKKPRPAGQVAASPDFAASAPRVLRAQAVHRLQIGLFGLAAMLLLVGLANIIMDRARLAERLNPAPAPITASGDTKAASDPLADIGVVPAADPSAESTQGKRP